MTIPHPAVDLDLQTRDTGTRTDECGNGTRLRRREELINCNTQTITQFLYSGNGCTAVASADDVVYRGLCYAAECTKFIDGNVMFAAQLQNAGFNRFSNIQGYHLFSIKMISIPY